MGAYFDLFMMKNTARVLLVAEGYTGGTQAPGLVNHVFRFSSPELPRLLICKQDSNSWSVGLLSIMIHAIK
jgi:hypothetical protein